MLVYLRSSIHSILFLLKRHWLKSITRLTHAIGTLEDSKKPETSDSHNCIAPRTPVVCIEIAVRVSSSITRTYLLYRDFVHRYSSMIEYKYNIWGLWWWISNNFNTLEVLRTLFHYIIYNYNLFI